MGRIDRSQPVFGVDEMPEDKINENANKVMLKSLWRKKPSWALDTMPAGLTRNEADRVLTYGIGRKRLPQSATTGMDRADGVSGRDCSASQITPPGPMGMFNLFNI